MAERKCVRGYRLRVSPRVAVAMEHLPPAQRVRILASIQCAMQLAARPPCAAEALGRSMEFQNEDCAGRLELDFRERTARLVSLCVLRQSA